MIVGANVASILVMLLIGHADLLQPVNFPKLSNIGLVFPALLIINFAFLVFWLFVKPRMVLVPFLGFLVCYGPVRRYMPINLPRDAPKGSIKVLSYNVWNFNSMMGENGNNAIIDYIAQQNADIVCLQEAAPNAMVQQAIDTVLRSVYQYIDTVRKGYGNGLMVLSKYPILSHEHIQYASKSNMSAAFVLKVKGREVLVVNNHLETTELSPEEKEKFKDLLKGDLKKDTATATSKWLVGHLGQQTAKRAPEADAVARYVAYHHDRPVILCGDFNDHPLSYVHRVMGQGLTDCYVATANGPGISYNRSGFFVRIDNIFCSDNFEPYACRVDNSIKASDHYPILCWLDMK